MEITFNPFVLDVVFKHLFQPYEITSNSIGIAYCTQVFSYVEKIDDNKEQINVKKENLIIDEIEFILLSDVKAFLQDIEEINIDKKREIIAFIKCGDVFSLKDTEIFNLVSKQLNYKNSFKHNLHYILFTFINFHNSIDVEHLNSNKILIKVYGKEFTPQVSFSVKNIQETVYKYSPLILSNSDSDTITDLPSNLLLYQIIKKIDNTKQQLQSNNNEDIKRRLELSEKQLKYLQLKAKLLELNNKY